jgi:mRNA-degrading endonuclease RelE of RelBE toxin-antitoxin system
MFKLVLTNHFIKQLKPYLKKHRSLKSDLQETLETFSPQSYPLIAKSTYKIRLRTKDLPRGKSKSFRLIVLFLQTGNLIVPLTIYFKGDKANISSHELKYHYLVTIAELEN